MARKITLTPEEVRATLAMAMAAMDEPAPEFVFDDAFLNFDWEADVPTPPAGASEPVLLSADKLPAYGSHPISIRVPARVIRAFKAQAARTGGSYQTLMNQALNQATTAFV